MFGLKKEEKIRKILSVKQFISLFVKQNNPYLNLMVLLIIKTSSGWGKRYTEPAILFSFV